MVCYGKYEGKDVLGICLSWNKCYIMLVLVVIVLGFVFKLSDLEYLFGDKEEIGIICVLIFVFYEGVEIGECYDLLGLVFMNGLICG